MILKILNCSCLIIDDRKACIDNISIEPVAGSRANNIFRPNPLKTIQTYATAHLNIALSNTHVLAFCLLRTMANPT